MQRGHERLVLARVLLLRLCRKSKGSQGSRHTTRYFLFFCHIFSLHFASGCVFGSSLLTFYLICSFFFVSSQELIGEVEGHVRFSNLSRNHMAEGAESGMDATHLFRQLRAYNY